MNTSTLIKVAFYFVVAIVAIELIGNVIGFLVSSWLVIAVLLAIWHFGFRKKNSA